MKRALLTILYLLAIQTAWSLPLTKEQAKSQARKYILQRHLQNEENIVLSDVSRPSFHKSPSKNPQSQSFYVFNVGTDNGFIIASGDDSTLPILGWCDHGSFDAENIPENMRALLESYEEEMELLRNAPHAAATPVAVKEAIAPMLTTKWGQDSPYNQQCPYYLNNSSNRRCMTGCVATSMAQVLAYSGNRPAGTTADIPAYTCTKKWTSDSIRINVTKKQKTTFDWDNMVDTYGKNATSEQQQAVAKLMAYCGAAIQADYGVEATSAYQYMVAPALRTFFNTDATRILRSNYTYTQWINIIYNELKAKRPVIHDGRSSGGGHSFVVDGFDGGELFHVNWGWNGNNDGYYALSILNPDDNNNIGASTSNDGYNYGQSAIIGIQPGVAPVYEPAQMTLSNIRVENDLVIFSIYNQTGETFNFDIGLGTIDDEGNISNVIKVKENQKLDNNWGYSSIAVSFRQSDLEPGVYHYVATSKESSSDIWLTTMNYWKQYVEITVAADHSVTLRMMPLDPDLSLVGELSYSQNNNYVGEAINITAKVKNDGGEFYGTLYFFVSQTNDKGKYDSQQGITLATGGTTDVVFSFTPSKEGTWNLWLCSDYEGKNVLGMNTMTVGKYTYTNPGYLEVTNLRIFSPVDESSWTIDEKGIRQVDVMSKSLMVTPTVRNTSSTDLPGENKVQVRLQQYKNNAWKTVKTINYTIKDFKANTGYNMIANGNEYIDFGNVGYSLYRIAIYLGNTMQDVHYQLNLTGGYPTWTADGSNSWMKTTEENLSIDDNVVAIDLSNYDFSDLTPNNNPNTLYFLGASQAVPPALQNKNVIQEGTASTITLTDGYSFFSPIDFTANSISYSRTFTTPFTSKGTGWNTLTLPFSPSTVVADNKQIDWFHSSEDENKNFFVMEMSGDEDAIIYFDYAKYFKPYRPYIIGLPGEEYGSACLTGKNIVFSAENIIVPATQQGVRTGSVYKFNGTTAKTAKMEHIYCINTNGDAFVPVNGSVNPFRSYITVQDVSPNYIAINFAHFIETGILPVLASDNQQPQGIYTLSGNKIDNSKIVDGRLPRGIYIVNGKKLLVK